MSVLPSGADIGRLARHVRLVLLRTSTREPKYAGSFIVRLEATWHTTVPDNCAGHTTRTIVAQGRVCSIKRRKRAVKLGGFTALPFRRRGAYSIER